MKRINTSLLYQFALSNKISFFSMVFWIALLLILIVLPFTNFSEIKAYDNEIVEIFERSFEMELYDRAYYLVDDLENFIKPDYFKALAADEMIELFNNDKEFVSFEAVTFAGSQYVHKWDAFYLFKDDFTLYDNYIVTNSDYLVVEELEKDRKIALFLFLCIWSLGICLFLAMTYVIFDMFSKFKDMRRVTQSFHIGGEHDEDD